MDKFDKLIDKHFGVIMSHKAASVQHYLETGSISGTFRMSLRHMLTDACDGNTSEREQANELLPLVSKSCHTTEIVQKYSDGTEEVKYRRPYGSDEALEMMQDVDKRCRKDGYFYRHVC